MIAVREGRLSVVLMLPQGDFYEEDDQIRALTLTKKQPYRSMSPTCFTLRKQRHMIAVRIGDESLVALVLPQEDCDEDDTRAPFRSVSGSD